MHPVTPTSAEELASALQEAAAKLHTIETAGNHSKHQMAGPVSSTDTTIYTTALNRILQYEPNDLTISAEAGMPFNELQTLLAKNGQMVALDPPFAARATVGGVVATNGSGPQRRAFGTARDLLIGMRFATLDGRLVSTGGMVVKNVAGLDMGKLLIGSFGTLGVITSVNFRLHPLPEETESFLFSFPDLNAVIAKRDAIAQSPLLPLAVDILSPPAAARLGSKGFVLAIRAGGSRRVLDRYARELPGSEHLTQSAEAEWWNQVREFSPDFMRRQPHGMVVRISTTQSDIPVLLRAISGPSISRASSGVTYAYLTSPQSLAAIWQAARQHNWSAVIEFAGDDVRGSQELWLPSASEHSAESFAIMKKVKHLFDPNNLLNRSRLYGRI